MLFPPSVFSDGNLSWRSALHRPSGPGCGWVIFHGRTEGYLRSAYCTWPGAFVHGRWCAAAGRSGGTGDQEMHLEGAEVEMSGADHSCWLMEIGCRSQTAALLDLNTEILPYFAHCRPGLVGTYASGLYSVRAAAFPKLQQTCGGRVAQWQTGLLRRCESVGGFCVAIS